MIDLDEKYDLYYYIKISTNKKVWVEEEALYKVVNGKTELAGGEKIFKTKLRTKESGDIQAEYNDKKAGRNPDILCMRVSSVLAQLRTKLPQNTDRDRECLGYIELVLENLKKIFILNPVPSDMRDYVRITDTDLKENCENISAVLRHLCEDSEKKKELLKIVSDYQKMKSRTLDSSPHSLMMLFLHSEKNILIRQNYLMQKNCQMEL